MRKVIISDGENSDNVNTCIKCGKEIPEGDIYCASCGKAADAEDEKPRFPRLDKSFMRNMPKDDEDDDYDDDEDDEEDDDIVTSYTQENRTMLIACIVAGAVVIAISFLFIGIFIGKNSKSPFVEHFKLREKTIYIDVIED